MTVLDPAARLTRRALAARALAAGGGAASTAAAQAAAAEQALAELPSGERWLEHFRGDLLPFWNTPDAWGEPRGNFPTFRCNDGRRLDPGSPCPELAGSRPQAKAGAAREFVRMKSRQTYFYGVAYHLTGDPKMLELARDGVQFIRNRAPRARKGGCKASDCA
jgi:mannose/cellobiose epimerase-like protein (N-acyl-D-glucosamine 2-epimerase family)